MKKVFFIVLLSLFIITIGWGLREGIYLAQDLSISDIIHPNKSSTSQQEEADDNLPEAENPETGLEGTEPEKPDSEQTPEQPGTEQPGSDDSAEPGAGQSGSKQPGQSNPQQPNNEPKPGKPANQNSEQDWLIIVNKTHHLDSSYVPKNLVIPDIPFPFSGQLEQMYVVAEVAEQLEKLFSQAKAENLYLYGLSGYRSYATQKTIFANNVKRFGSEEEANKISAKAGQSEHQTGLAMDVTCKAVNFSLVQSFADTPEGKWLKENAHKFGFIIRYPKGKEDITGYVYEPWHLRYVGVGPATEIYNLGVTLEEYLNQL